MAGQRNGSGEDRKLSTTYLVSSLWKGKDGKRENQKAVEELLGLPHGWVADHLGKRGLEEEDFVLKTQLGRDKGRLDDQFVFEFGLRQLISSQTPSRPSSDIAVVLERRHEAYEIFDIGVKRLRHGRFPTTKNGTPRKLSKAAPQEVWAALEAWLERIEALGCNVMDAGEWLDWFRFTDPNRTIGQFLQSWFDSYPPREAPCPPIYGLNVDLWDNYEMLTSPAFLDSLILVTESDMPYSVYHARFEQAKPTYGSSNCSRSTSGVSIWTDEEGGEWESEYRISGDIDAFIDRKSRRKSGGARS